MDSVSREQLIEESVESMLQILDPHSQYISREDFNAINDPLLGSFEGIGVQFNILKDTIVIVHTIPGGPSEKVGILAGDRIVNVDDSLIAGVGLTDRDAMRKLKGPRGTKVNVGIFRKGFSEIIDFDIIRDIIPTYSLDISYMYKLLPYYHQNIL